jgi:hypothetical protein
MSINDVDMALDAINNNESACFFAGSRDDALIKKAEKTLGLKFPPSYYKYLAKLGCGSVGSEEIYGIIDDDFFDSSVPDAIWVTLQQRKMCRIKDDLVIIYSFGDGDYAALLCLPTQGEGPIIRVSPGNPVNYQEILASDFGVFFWERVKEALDLS